MFKDEVGGDPGDLAEIKEELFTLLADVLGAGIAAGV